MPNESEIWKLFWLSQILAGLLPPAPAVANLCNYMVTVS